MFGLTRRLAIPLLEHLDAAKVTRRVGDRREIVKGPVAGAGDSDCRLSYGPIGRRSA